MELSKNMKKITLFGMGVLFFLGIDVQAQKKKRDTASVTDIKEVTVSTGYQKLSKRTFTGSASKIVAKDLVVEGIPDVSRMIEGKVSGVNVQNATGTFGIAPKITICSSSSIFGDTKPLWVIDGIVQKDVINVSFEDLASGNALTLLISAVAGLNSANVESI